MPFKFDEIPVSTKLDETVKAALDQIKKEKRRKSGRKFLVGCTSVAAAFAAAVIFCVSNPALAAKLPLVGSLFAGLEDDFPYAGDYSDRAQILTPPETPAALETPGEGQAGGEAPAGEEGSAPEDTAAPADGPYSATDSGLTFTASEIYSDGLSVFLSLQIHSEEAFGFNYDWTEDGDGGKPARDETGNLIPLPASLYPVGRAYIDSEEVVFDSTRLFVEQLDEHNFNGMIKTDLPASMRGMGGSHTMQVSLQHLLADFCDETGAPVSNEENIMDTSLQIDGAWELELPFTADIGSTQVFNNLSSSKDPGQITDVYVSPYQAVVNFVPCSDEWGNPEGGAVCFDENGTLLEKGNQSTDFGSDVFSLDFGPDKKQPAELRLYVIEDWIASCKIRDEETARKQAVSSLTLPLSR